MKALFVGSRSCTILVDPDGDYYSKGEYTLCLSDGREMTQNLSVLTVFGLEPQTEYRAKASINGQTQELSFTTKAEFCTLNARDFGALGDGVHDDTAALQAAILCCPEGGRVLVPKGVYLTGPLFLKSHFTLHLDAEAKLKLTTDRSRFPLLPGRVDAKNEKGEHLIGSWEGEFKTSYASALTGIGVRDVVICGEGCLDGSGDTADWWPRVRAKEQGLPARPRMLYLRDCEDMTMQGVGVYNSPAWNLHPCFSSNVRFLSVHVHAPWNSPNTDGFDPDSCTGVRVYGTLFSVGDDCIAIKSGTLYMGKTYQTPCQDVEIAWCHMLDGHGGVTIGSEMSGGVKNVRVHHCLMTGNDRGLRIKTRRGRGKWGVIDDIVFEDVKMMGVKAPLTVNAMYACGPDGKSDYVQCREPLPVDDGTPSIGSVRYERVTATDCRMCAAYILGLPENPMEEMCLKDCSFALDPTAEPMKEPIMACHIPPCSRRGVIARFAKRIILENVSITGYEGPRVEASDIGELVDA